MRQLCSTLCPLFSGRLVGNIRSQGTVKRTVIRGRVGARPAGMRLPPPMSSPEAVPASKEAATAAKDTGAATDKTGDKQVVTEPKAVKDEDKVCLTVHTWCLGHTTSTGHIKSSCSFWVLQSLLSFQQCAHSKHQAHLSIKACLTF